MFFIGISGTYASDINSSPSSDITDKNVNIEIKNDAKAVNDAFNTNLTINNTIKSNNANTTNQVNTNSKTNLKGNTAAGKPTKLTQIQILAASKSMNTYIKKNKKLSNYITIHGYKFSMPEYTRTSTNTTIPTSKTITINLLSLDEKDAASRVNTYGNQKDILPNYVEINDKKYIMAQFLYLLSVTITKTNSGSTSRISLISVNNPNKPTGSSIKGKLTKAQYLSLANNVTNFIKTNKQAPNYARSPLGNIQFQTLVSEFSKIVEYVFINKKLPSSVTINVKSTDSINSGGITGGRTSKTTVLNDNYNEESLAQYLKATKNCQVTNSIINSLAASITKNCNNDLEKASAIYNWMQKNIDYNFYYDTRKGAVGTYNAKFGNCVDQAHLSIALYRAAGLAARYVHGTCTFSSGNVYGHVWVQVLIEDTWTVSDSTSSRNALGVVNNWNPNTYTLKTGKVAEISF